MKKFCKGAIVLLIAFSLIFTSIAIANTVSKIEDNKVCLTDEPVSIYQPGIDTFGRAILWDQYDTDGSNGLSHMDKTSTGTKRHLLDDFQVPDETTWILTDLHSLNLWNTLQPGSGTDFYLEIWTDNAGTPGTVIAIAATVSYTETATGRSWFSRPEFEIEYVFEPIILGPGVYWINGHVIGPENCFWMARQDVIWGSECWCDYEDYPPLQPGSNINGGAYDLAYQLTGEVQQPAIPAICCDPGIVSWTNVKPGTTVTGTFFVWNCGEEDSVLNWQVDVWPAWMGSPIFTPSSGSILESDPGTDVTFTFTAPSDENQVFSGMLKVINVDDPTDFCEMDLSLETPRTRGILFNFLEYLANHFPLIQNLFGF